jgi:hypothetical protein
MEKQINNIKWKGMEEINKYNNNKVINKIINEK